jgi:tetratricopeptide (TPR) repeat protein
MVASVSSRDSSGDTTLSRTEKPHSSADLRRRDFLIRFCQGAGASLIPSGLWGLARGLGLANSNPFLADSEYQLHPHYRAERPLDAVLAKVQTGCDDFITEKYADQMGAILDEWRNALLEAPRNARALERILSADFSGVSFQPTESRTIRSFCFLEVRQNKFSGQATLDKGAFLRGMQSYFAAFSKIVTAEFQITAIDAGADASQPPQKLQTRVRYELVGTGGDFYREQRVGYWDLLWVPSEGAFRIRNWLALEETQARSRSPIYTDITASVFGGNASYSAQLLHGSDYWRTLLDGASGIDLYGHNGVSIADIDNDGFDDLYVCQPAGLPNRLYRNRGDGTFEDITETSGLGILENTACALFADFDNDGRQDAILVRTSGPLLFLNEGNGKFRLKPDAFQFANPPQGTFTGAAVADYDRDDWLDIYFCLYTFYQGTGQYQYPLPYHEAENGPPNFLMRNNRDGSFRDVTAESGLNQNNTRYSFCCSWSDYHNHGWPDLYVVNDFGKKNLYRNNGDGTFTDVAHGAGVEDVGAGMSVCWLDYDNGGSQDLYVANMWTAAGERISTQPVFKKDSAQDVRALFQKHAMGNSLLKNRGAEFEDTTIRSRSGMGRWAWSSDAFDFDHDGFPDLYITNGMVSGISQPDLNSFFWRQVVAVSPDEAHASQDYEQGWNAINELIRSDGTWSGYERNVFYANNGDGTFSDVSAAVGLDFLEDGRSFALADLDHDGRLEVVLKNRNAPQLRVLKNVVDELPPSVAFRLEGSKSNRDAIGAVVTIDAGGLRQTRVLQAGSGFLSQHGKDVFFGLGSAKEHINASIRWPSGRVQELPDLPINGRIWVKEGSEPSRIEAFKRAVMKSTSLAPLGEREILPANVETWLLAPVPAPDFSLPDRLGQPRTLSGLRGQPVLLNLCNPEAHEFEEDLNVFQKNAAQWASRGLRLVVVMIGGPEPRASQFHNSDHVVLRGSDDFAAIYNILFRQLFDRHRDLRLPTSFLINRKGEIVKVYAGPINAERIEKDFGNIPATDAECLSRGLPFPSATYSLEVGRNYLSLGTLFFQRGYLAEAKAAFEQASRENPSSAEALYGIGSIYLNQNMNAEAREVFERIVKLQADYPNTLPDTWNNLGVIATRDGQIEESIQHFQHSLRLNPHHLAALDNLGNAYRVEKRWEEARQAFERALSVSPDDPEANYSLAMVFAQTDDTAKAYEYFQRALKARPVYPEALNNLGVLYLRTQRRDQAVATFEQCIRVAPAFEQAYLNLARVFALEGTREKARGVLVDLLKQKPDDPQAKQLLEQLN